MIRRLGALAAELAGHVYRALFRGPEYEVQDDGMTARLVCKDCGQIVLEGPSGMFDGVDIDPEVAYVGDLLRQQGYEVYSRGGSRECCWPPAPGRRCPRGAAGRSAGRRPHRCSNRRAAP